MAVRQEGFSFQGMGYSRQQDRRIGTVDEYAHVAYEEAYVAPPLSPFFLRR